MAEKPPSVTIIDYGMGNLSSVARAFESLHATVTVTNDPRDIEQAERLVLPGVGAFGEGMKNLRRLGLIEPLTRQVRSKGTPFLGICLGMQLLATKSLEQGEHGGLAWIDATVKPFLRTDDGFRTTHIRWNRVYAKPNPFIPSTGRKPEYYFVHGYHFELEQDASYVLGTTNYGVEFPSAILSGNIAGVQFHPEKSQEAGLGMLRNFLRWNPREQNVDPNFKKEPAGYKRNIRIIPTLLYSNGRLTKTIQFQIQESGIRKDVGDPVKASVVYDAQLADELILLDFRATVEGRGTEELARVISDISGHAFMPLTAGGGIRTVEQIRSLLSAGADKVAINTAAVERPDFIREAAQINGDQCIVVSIDVSKKNGSHEVFTHSGMKATGLSPVEWAQKAAKLGAGEILLTSIDQDGMMTGYDLELAQLVCKEVEIPVILSGGAGTLQDLAQVTTNGCADAVAAASLFHFRDISPIKAKAFLNRTGGFSVRN